MNELLPLRNQNSASASASVWQSCCCRMRNHFGCSTVWPSEMNLNDNSQQWSRKNAIGKWIIRFCYLLRIYLNEVYFSFRFRSVLVLGSRTDCRLPTVRYYLYITKFNVCRFIIWCCFVCCWMVSVCVAFLVSPNAILLILFYYMGVCMLSFGIIAILCVLFSLFRFSRNRLPFSVVKVDAVLTTMDGVICVWISFS